MLIHDLYTIFLKHPSVQTDTRKLQNGDIFFALKGTAFNGNTFVRQALENGAAYAVADEPQPFSDERIIYTENALQTLQELAKYHREQFTIPFLAITGSNGKTTTKELIHEVLKTTFPTYTTKGNFNNHIGIPLTILSVKKDAQIAVIEMGANHQREIEGYCRYTLPTHGLITNCGKAHLEGFGGIEGVKKGKGELYAYLKEHDGTAFIMNDYEYLREMSAGIKNVFSYGTNNAAITGRILNNNEFLHVEINAGTNNFTIKSNLVGEYNLPNILAAVCVGVYFKIPVEKIKQAIENYTPSNSRSQLIDTGTYKIILDAYNANPTSMRAAIENIAKESTGDKILLIGGMMELGNESLAEHEAIISLIDEYKWKNVVLVGGDFARTKHKYIFFENSDAAKEWFHSQDISGCTVLVKGSRSMQMEKVLD